MKRIYSKRSCKKTLSRDGWIDGIINEYELGLSRLYTQAKRFTKWNLGEKDIRNFIWSMSWDLDKWIFVTTSNFDSKAKEKSKSAMHKIILINWGKLSELMIKYNIWVQIKNIYEIKELDWNFFIED